MKMKSCIIYLFCCLIGMSLSYAQDMMKLSGKVIDIDTNDPLSYASIGVKGRPMGTITNSDGVFELALPKTENLDTLQVSMMGYGAYEMQVKKFSEGTGVIALKEKILVMHEVEINDTKLTGNQIMVKVFEKIQENFPVQPYVLKTFFREMYVEDDITAFVMDASVDIYDARGYQQVKGNKNFVLVEKSRVNNVRASSPNFKCLPWRNHFLYGGGFNYLAYALWWKNVKYRDQTTKQFFAERNYVLDSVIYSNEDNLYVVKGTILKDNYTNTNIYYIDSKTFAVVKHEFEDVAEKGQTIDEWKFPQDSNYTYKSIHRHVVQEYSKYKGKMYLKFINGDFFAEITNNKTKQIESRLLTNELLMVGEIQDEGITTKYNEVISPNQSLILKTGLYSADFWKSYDEAKLFPLTAKQKRDLEKESSLQDQFKKSPDFSKIKVRK